MNGTPNSSTAVQLAAKIRANVVGLRHTTASVRDGAAYNRYIDNLLDTADTLDPPQHASTHERVKETEAPTGIAKNSASVLEMGHRFAKPIHKRTTSSLQSDSKQALSEYRADNLRLESMRQMDESGIDQCLSEPERKDPSFGE